MPEEATEESTEVEPAEDGGSGSSSAVPVQRITIICVGFVVAMALGAGGFLIGKNSGEDLESAREVGSSVGKKAGEERGEKQGFKLGLKQGRKNGYDRSFRVAFKDAYLAAWNDAGLEPPARGNVEVPQR